MFARARRGPTPTSLTAIITSTHRPGRPLDRRRFCQGRERADRRLDHGCLLGRGHKEIKYQIGDGSSIDQLLGQWHASLYGLGEIFDPAIRWPRPMPPSTSTTYIPVMGDVYNPCRIYCLNDEGGLVICAWPKGAQKPTIPAPYSRKKR